MKALVGYTGFVGSNLASQHVFDGLYHSRNIESAYDTKPDLLVYSGVRAEKFLANSDPEKDYGYVKDAMHNIEQINPKSLILISTIDVYKNPLGVDEDSVMDTDDLHPYGLNRFYLEQWVREQYKDALIVRLPALFGKNLKKNFIYDMIHIIPAMLNEVKFTELSEKNNLIGEYYTKLDNGFYKLGEITQTQRAALKEYFLSNGFTALNFTDSRAGFQFYNLNYLWSNLMTAREKGIKILNINSEPIKAAEIYRSVTGSDFTNEVAKIVPDYDIKTKHDAVFGGNNGYMFSKESILSDIQGYIKEHQS
ncbi:MAG: hypothetical protein BGN88_10765 [Clostridiales bacterium 43-6]|nr:MAG: hypothetical protein BGN88_10765 [Clostridiales bacterium 43-6]